MDMSQLAESLGLPKDSPQDKVFAALAIRLAEGDAAKTELASVKESLSKLNGELTASGMKLDQGKLVKVNAVDALDLTIKPDDDEEKVTLKKNELARRLDAQKAQLAQDKALVEGLSKSGRLPPAVTAALNKLVGLKGRVEVLALSKDGKEVLSAPEEARTLILQVLNGLGSLPQLTTPAGLSRMGVEKAEQKEPEALSKEGAEIAARVAPGRTKSQREKAASGK